MKNIFTVLVLSFMMALPVTAQDSPLSDPVPADTICFPVETAQQIQIRLERLEQENEINERIIAELNNQIDLYQTRVHQDSTIIALQERNLELYKENAGYNAVEAHQEQLNAFRWLYGAGGALVGVIIGAVVFN